MFVGLPEHCDEKIEEHDGHHEEVHDHDNPGPVPVDAAVVQPFENSRLAQHGLENVQPHLQNDRTCLLSFVLLLLVLLLVLAFASRRSLPGGYKSGIHRVRKETHETKMNLICMVRTQLNNQTHLHTVYITKT